MLLGTMTGLNDQLLAALTKLNDAYKEATGQEINFTSGKRTFQHQKELYEAEQARKPGSKFVARPGHSSHETGEATDINKGQIEDIVKRVGGLEQFGLHRPLLHNPSAPENWHIQLLPGGGFIPDTNLTYESGGKKMGLFDDIGIDTGGGMGDLQNKLKTTMAAGGEGGGGFMEQLNAALNPVKQTMDTLGSIATPIIDIIGLNRIRNAQKAHTAWLGHQADAGMKRASTLPGGNIT